MPDLFVQGTTAYTGAMNLAWARKMFSEWRSVISFGIIGVTCLSLHLGVYGLLSRVLFISVDQTLLNAVTVIIVSFVNYELNRHFTFQRHPRGMRSIMRFATVAVGAIMLNSFLFWLLHAVANIPDFAVIPMNAVLVAFFTFTCHRFFTFRASPTP